MPVRILLPLTSPFLSLFAQSGYTSSCPVPAGTIASSGFAQWTQYNAVPCNAANAATSYKSNNNGFVKLGLCDPQTQLTVGFQGSNNGRPQRWQSQRTDAYTSGSTTVFVKTYFNGVSCGASAASSMYYYIAGRSEHDAFEWFLLVLLTSVTHPPLHAVTAARRPGLLPPRAIIPLLWPRHLSQHFPPLHPLARLGSSKFIL